MPSGSFTVSVPGSSANLGPGFDCLALALPLRLTVTVTPRPGPLGVRLAGEGVDELPADETNLVAATMLEASGHDAEGLELAIENTLPLGAGCGSSAAAIVAGLAAAARLRGEPVEPEDLLARAAAIEGHPDNVAASVLGGVTIAYGRPARARRISPPDDLLLVLVVPVERLPTTLARGLLPPVVERLDAVANIAGTALLVDALHAGRIEDLADALDDRLHEQARVELAPTFDRLRRRREELGVLGVTLSGAGPSALVWCRPGTAAGVAARIAALEPEARAWVVAPERRGLRIEG